MFRGVYPNRPGDDAGTDADLRELAERHRYACCAVLTLVSMAGTGWTCPGTADNNCTRADALIAGAP